MTEAYIEGFAKMAEECGVDPQALMKYAGKLNLGLAFLRNLRSVSRSTQSPAELKQLFKDRLAALERMNWKRPSPSSKLDQSLRDRAAGVGYVGEDIDSVRGRLAGRGYNFGGMPASDVAIRGYGLPDSATVGDVIAAKASGRPYNNVTTHVDVKRRYNGSARNTNSGTRTTLPSETGQMPGWEWWPHD